MPTYRKDDVVEVTAGESITLPLREPGPAVKVIGDGVGAPAPKTYRKETEVIGHHEIDMEGSRIQASLLSETISSILPEEARAAGRRGPRQGPRGRFRIVVEFTPDEG